MSWYEDRFLPRFIDLACSSKPTRKQREKIVPRASGDVLEIGIGSGLNLPHYDREKVRHIWGLEPSAGMRRIAADPIMASGLDVELRLALLRLLFPGEFSDVLSARRRRK